MTGFVVSLVVLLVVAVLGGVWAVAGSWLLAELRRRRRAGARRGSLR